MNQVIPARPTLFDILQHIDKGAAAVEIDEAGRACVQASMQTGKKTKITVEIEFDPDMKTDAMRVVSRVKVKLPDPPKKAALFFPTPEGNLQRHDARQARMFPGSED